MKCSFSFEIFDLGLQIPPPPQKKGLGLGVSEWGFLRGGEVSIIGVAHAPVAIINFAFFVQDLLIESYKNSEILQGFDAKLIIATGARTTPIIGIPPLTQNPPFGNP